MELSSERFSGLVLLDTGANSQCLTDGSRVVKVTKCGMDEERAQARLDRLKDEYRQIKLHLGTMALDSEFSLVNDAKGWLLCIAQEHKSGRPLRNSLNPRNPSQRDFFERILCLYQQTRLVPDVLPDIMPDPFGGIYFTGRYTYLSGPNVFLVEGSPTLVDTTLNRILRSRITGPILKALVAKRIELLLR